MKLFGLIGYPLSHSFSKKFFTEKFEKENIRDCRYELFEIPKAEMVKDIVSNNPELKGLNVTIPHKENIIPFLNHIDPAAKKIGAVNVIKIDNGKLTGYNSDYFGFKSSLLSFIPDTQMKALVLGSGGAAKAVIAALDECGIQHVSVSRKKVNDQLTYPEVDQTIIKEHSLIINTTPLGMYPNTDARPELPYQYLSSSHYLFDLVYNPTQTSFMLEGEKRGAKTKNGLEMLYLQAEKAWEIWNEQT